MLGNFATGFHVLFSFSNVLAVVAGAVLGVVVGMLPGLGPSSGVALLIPITYRLPAATSLVLLTSLWLAAEYSGSITAILLSVPGTPAAAATVADGYALTQKGQVGKAMGVSLWSALIGAFVGLFVLVVFTGPLAQFAISFGPGEYFLLGALGLVLVSGLSGRNLLKGIFTAALGVWLTTVGTDIVTGIPRFTFGWSALLGGIPLLPVLLGLFAIAEAFRGLETVFEPKKAPKKVAVQLSFKDFRKISPFAAVGSLVGTIVGVIPGAGAGIGSWVAYDFARRISRKPEEFGRGALGGIAAPEAANTAVTGTSMLPLLAFAIPGSPTAAIILGAFMIHGLQPGPNLLSSSSAPVIYAMYSSFILAMVVIFLVGKLGVPYFAKILQLPPSVLHALVIVLALLGAYVGRNFLFDSWLALGFGIFGYVLRKLDYPLPPLILGLVLGGMIENNLRRALIISGGSWTFLFSRPETAAMLALLVVFLGWTVRSQLRALGRPDRP